ncbi:MAG TPA: valine--tRNA ligase [Patescibacteria group bacterium]|nr:valine--tRNA ligase [Patescibacteria group bacterium]
MKKTSQQSLQKRAELPKQYDPQKIEDSIYRHWEQSGFFNPDHCLGEKTKPFSLMMPPPNATGVLHLGHAMENSLHDVIVRYHRMKGEKTLWVPGVDHAAIATQNKVEKLIAQEGKTRHDLGREKFLERVDQYVEESKITIEHQLRKLGASCDWSREAYTMSPILTKCVQEVFVNMYNDGLIVRGNRLVNWCPRCESTLADDEVEHTETEGKLYYIEYPIKDSKKHITVATTRPETMLGDTAVAVNPQDERYKHLIGKTVILPLANREIPIIADRHVNPAFGTGAVKVTPAHDFNDNQIAKRHKLEYINIFNPDGTLNEHGGKYHNWTVADTRKLVIEELEQRGLLKKTKKHTHNVGHCYRCDAVVEPYLSLQWFISVDKPAVVWKGKKRTLKEIALDVIKSGNIEIMPARFKKTYFHWIDNLQDWCISRQIWFGHRIPVWYCQMSNAKCQMSKPIASIEPPKKCKHCGSTTFTQDPDTLDTWFSSALWTFSTLLDKKIKKGELLHEWLKRSPDFKIFHPTSVMAPGYEILFFWVARMILMTTYNTKQVPFKTVYLHGMVRDKEGKKMSKSLGNGIDPVEMIEKYGTDALRLSLIIGSTPGNDMKMYEEKIEGFRNFINKLWNISRFILTTVDTPRLIEKKPKTQTVSDEWILAELDILVRDVTKHMDNFEFSPAGEKLREFTWDKFADWYVEIAKIEQNKDEILLYILQILLRLWHPFIPFITEKIWGELNTPPHPLLVKAGERRPPLLYKERAGVRSSSLLLATSYPQTTTIRTSPTIKHHAVIRDIITAIRNARAELKVEPSQIVSVKTTPEGVSTNRTLIEKLARIKFTTQTQTNTQGHTIHEHGISLTLHIPRDNKKINKEKKELENYIKSLEQKLANQEFLTKAPTSVISTERTKLKEAQEKLEKL